VNPARPLVLALVVCDGVWRDPSSGKHSLMGVFSGLSAGVFPVQHPGLAVYAALTEGYGMAQVRVAVVDDGGAQVIAEATVQVAFTDPRQVVELTVGMQTLTFPLPGGYRIQLIADGHILLERRLAVRQL
jgi:hypothetical protein